MPFFLAARCPFAAGMLLESNVLSNYTIAGARRLLAYCSYDFVEPGDHEMLYRSVQHWVVGCACSLAD